MAKNAKRNEYEPWWHEDASEFTGDDADGLPDDSSPDSTEMLNTATQEAVKLAATLSTWAEQTGFSDIIRNVAKQAVDTAQDAAVSLMEAAEPNEAEDPNLDEDLTEDADLDTDLTVADLDEAAFDLESEDYAHLDADPAAAGVVQVDVAPKQGGAPTDHSYHASATRSGVRITCDYCPICRVIESLDDLNPETAAAIAEVMAVVTDGVASAVMELVPKSTGADS